MESNRNIQYPTLQASYSLPPLHQINEIQSLPHAPQPLPPPQIDAMQSLPGHAPQQQTHGSFGANQVALPVEYNAPVVSSAATSSRGCRPTVAVVAVVTAVLVVGGIIAGVVISVSNNTDASYSSCTGYTCHTSGQCILSSYVCDGINDCSQEEDEMQCANQTTGTEDNVAENMFACPGTSVEISNTQVCDGTEDCQGGADEDRCVIAPDGGGGGNVRVYSVATKSHHRFCGYSDGWTDAKSDSVCRLLGFGASATTTEDVAPGEAGITSNGDFVLSLVVQKKTVTCIDDKLVRITCAAPATSCGTKRAGRIVGGSDAAIEDHPWQVALLRTSSAGFTFQFCGGTIVSERWIVSAAHCFQDISSDTVVQALAGTSTISLSTNLLYNIDKIVSHPTYSKDTNFMDIAVLHVTRDFLYSSTIQPACLPVSGQVFADGTAAVASGWGTTTEDGSSSNTLQAVTVPLHNIASCGTTFPSMASALLHGMICAGLQEGGKDSCQGDSGGPLVIDHNSVHYLIGATSFGFGCARPNSAGVYAEVSYARDWITREMNKI